MTSHDSNVKINVVRKWLLIIVAALIFTAADSAQADVLKVGSKRFTESYILAEVLAQQVKAKSKTEVRVLQGLGNTAIVYAALKAGSIDLYPEYAGTIAQEILKSAAPLSIDEMNRQLAPLGFGVAIPLGFNNGYALAMRSADAEKLNINTLSDLAKKSDQRLGLSNEFIGRADGWKGLSTRYGFTQSPSSLDHGLAFAAIEKKQIDVIDIYTTDAQIDHMKLRVLEDNLGYFPRYDAVVLYRLDVPTRFPDAWTALQKLTNSIDAAAMIKMNARAELESAPFDVIARDRLASVSGFNPPTSANERGFMAKLFGDDLARLTGQHLLLVLVSVGIATLIAIPLAVVIFPHARLRSVVLGIAGLMQTVPSLALLAVLISLIGVIGILPALIALTLYALLPIMRNTCAGLGEVSDGLRQAGKALGMSARDMLMQIELPLAMPTIIAGVRTATAISIGTATIAAFIGAGGYGERIVTGLALNDRQLLLAGAIPAAAMALAGELLFEWFERAIRKKQGGK